MSEQQNVAVAPVAVPVVVQAQPLPTPAPVASAPVAAPAPAPVLQVVAPAPQAAAPLVAAVDPKPTLLRQAGAVGIAVGIVGVGCAAGECAAGFIPGVGPVLRVVMRVAGPAIAAPFAAWVARLVRG